MKWDNDTYKWTVSVVCWTLIAIVFFAFAAK